MGNSTPLHIYLCVCEYVHVGGGERPGFHKNECLFCMCVCYFVLCVCVCACVWWGYISIRYLPFYIVFWTYIYINSLINSNIPKHMHKCITITSNCIQMTDIYLSHKCSIFVHFYCNPLCLYSVTLLNKRKNSVLTFAIHIA